MNGTVQHGGFTQLKGTPSKGMNILLECIINMYRIPTQLIGVPLYVVPCYVETTVLRLKYVSGDHIPYDTLITITLLQHV